ncbi:MAG: hypothetical protein OEW08_13935, partial [Gammaproteobacteria bacterium]|nr:hypothetical protein [Gammaproteobacteria bacterium]
YVDGERKEFTFNLHVMAADGSAIEQISYGLSHDRHPVVTSDGQILFSRWDKSARRSKFSLYKIYPDGHGLTSYYGAHSPGNVFFQPREMADGRLIANVMPLAGSAGGGALMLINARQFGDIDDAAPGAQGDAQSQAGVQQVPIDDPTFDVGRFAAPYPIPGGGARILVSYASALQTADSEPGFGLYVYDLLHKNFSPLVPPEPGRVISDPVAVMPTTSPPVLPRLLPIAIPKERDDKSSYGILNIKSVYDVDKRGYLGNNATLTEAERVSMSIPYLELPGDTRGSVPDLATLRDPQKTKAAQRAARFLRVVGAVPMPAELPPNVIGLTPMGAKRILGYVPVEPDGSVRVRVPVDTPIAVTVVDAAGRAFVDHDDWFQVRAGEELVCNGCHSYKRRGPVNTGTPDGVFANTQLRNDNNVTILDAATQRPARALSFETMAEMRTRLDSMTVMLMPDLHFVDVWTIGPTVDPPIHWHYGELPSSLVAPVNGVVDYQLNVQPIWDEVRPVLYTATGYTGDNKSCADCHNGISNSVSNPSGLDLRKQPVAGSARAASYESLLNGKIEFDPVTHFPQYTLADGHVNLKRAESLVMAGHARGSYLVQLLTGEKLHAGRSMPTTPTVNHKAMLESSPAERLIISEWIDIGAQYYNAIIGADGKPVKAQNPLMLSEFYLSGAYDVLKNRCAVCHMLLIRGTQPNYAFRESQFILTGYLEDDYFAASQMVNYTDPSNSKLVTRPLTVVDHPPRTLNSVLPVFDLSIAFDRQDYNRLLGWASSARAR